MHEVHYGKSCHYTVSIAVKKVTKETQRLTLACLTSLSEGMHSLYTLQFAKL